MNKVIFYTAILVGLVIVVAFYAGSTNLVAVIASAINKLLLTLQGRTSKGSFASYPGGAPSVPKAA